MSQQQQQQLNQNTTSQSSNSQKSSYKANSAGAPGTPASTWTDHTRNAKINTRSMPLPGKQGVRALVFAIATVFSVPNPRYYISKAKHIKGRLTKYDESDEDFLLRSHEMNFNKSHPPPPDSPDRRPFNKDDNSWATSWSWLVRAEYIRRRNAIPGQLRAKLGRAPTRDEIKAARDALLQESRTAGFVPLSFGITSPLQWMEALCYGVNFDFGVVFEYVRDEDGRIKTKGAKKTKVIDPEKTQYEFGFSVPLMKGGERTGVRGCSTFDEVMTLIDSQEYVPEEHATLCGLPMNRGFAQQARRRIGIHPGNATTWARERQHNADEIVRVLTKLGFDTEEKRAAHCEKQERSFLEFWMFKMTHTLTHGEGVSESTFEVRNLWSQFRVCYYAAQNGHAETPKKKGAVAWVLEDGKAIPKRLMNASLGKARRHEEAQVPAPKGGGAESASSSNKFAVLEVDASPPGAAAAPAAPAEPTLADLAGKQLPKQKPVPRAKPSTGLSRRRDGRAQRDAKKAAAAAAAKPKRKKPCRHGGACWLVGCRFDHPEGHCPVAAKERAEAAEAQESAPAAPAPPPADEPKGPTAEEMRLAQEVFTQQEEMAQMKAQMEEMKRMLAQQTKAEEKPLPTGPKQRPPAPPRNAPKDLRNGFGWMS